MFQAEGTGNKKAGFFIFPIRRPAHVLSFEGMAIKLCFYRMVFIQLSRERDAHIAVRVLKKG
jgi:hypothetical protein